MLAYATHFDMWTFSILTLLFLLKLGQSKKEGDPAPSTSKSTAHLISMPTNTFYIANNTQLEVKCVIKGELTGVPNLQFVNDADNVELLNTDRLTITINKNKATNVTTGIFLWNPVYVRDNTVKSVRCRNKGTTMDTKMFNMVVIPTASIPTVRITNDSEVSIKKGSNAQIMCEVTCKTGTIVKEFSATWKINDLNSQHKLPQNTKIKFDIKGSTVTSTLSITNFNQNDARKYYCIARMKFEAFEIVREYYAQINVKVLEDSGLNTYEVESMQGEHAKLDCEGTGVPKELPKVKWWKKERNKDEVEIPADDVFEMNTRYVYEISGKDKTKSAPNSVLKIENVDSTDRAKYICRVEFLNWNVTKTFTLRVRDPLGALWPFLGIVIEAILLVVIIRGFESYSKKNPKKRKLDEKDSVHTSETSPLVKNSNEEGARQRTPANEASA